MSNKERSTTLYKTPFSAAYWHDAAAELKSTKTLVIAALMIALRVATKGLAVPIAPGLRLFSVASFINALGAMIIGPVVAIPAAFLSDFLGVLLWEGLGTYFLPYVLQEIGSSLIWALLLYRAKVSTWRVLLGRFSICILINVVLGVSIDIMYQQFFYGTSTVVLTVPRVLKNTFMFPVEAAVMTLFLRLMIPITSRMGLTYGGSDARQSMAMGKKQIVALAGLFVAGAVIVVSYLFYYYDTTSVSSQYSAKERFEINCSMDSYLDQHEQAYPDEHTVTIVESAYDKFLGTTTTYHVAVYEVDEEALADYDKDLQTIQGMSKSKAAAVAKDGVMTRIATAVIVVNDNTGEVVELTYEPVA